MSKGQDLYEVLGVEWDADRDAIRKVYRKLARQFHPDVNPGDEKAEERFKEISAAWGVLGDEEARKNYDEFGEVSLDSGFDAEEARKAREAFGAHFGGDANAGRQDAFHFGEIDDLLGHLFSQEGASRAAGLKMRGADLDASLELEFLEAVLGGEKTLSLQRGPGAGVETVKVRIPPGVDSKGRLRIPGKGGAGHGGGPPGDLWVSLRVRPHRVFRREGKNLTLEVPVSVREASLGSQVEVPTLDGRVSLTVPAGSDSGTRLRLRGKGVPGPRKEAAGDLLVRLKIVTPTGLDDEGKAAIESLQRFEDPSLRKELFE